MPQLKIVRNTCCVIDLISLPIMVPDAVNTIICAPNDGWRDHPKHVEQFTDKINCI